MEARATFQGHTQVVGALDWAERDTIYSASWDHSLRIWDVETAVNTQTLVSLFLGSTGSPFPRVLSSLIYLKSLMIWTCSSVDVLNMISLGDD